MTQIGRAVTTLEHDAIPINELKWNKYQKRPVIVSATRMKVPFRVETLEGWTQGAAGSWLIEGIMGELYPCRHDIFCATYEQADE